MHACASFPPAEKDKLLRALLRSANNAKPAAHRGAGVSQALCYGALCAVLWFLGRAAVKEHLDLHAAFAMLGRRGG